MGSTGMLCAVPVLPRAYRYCPAGVPMRILVWGGMLRGSDWGEGEFLTYSLVVVGVAEMFLSCWGRGGIIVAYACSFCQG